ncbi:hypothetical protein BGW41_008298 [Actinomortierella wolfii]|nr:hypothetical protein BGW41_008298 [Actinomortierella wolfii]
MDKNIKPEPHTPTNRGSATSTPVVDTLLVPTLGSTVAYDNRVVANGNGSGPPPTLFGVNNSYEYDAYRAAISDLNSYRTYSSRTPTATYKNSITHPINVSWMIPPWLSVLLQEDMSLPNGVRDLNDLAYRERQPDFATPSFEEAIAKAQQRYPNWRPRGNMGLCSCPGKKVRLDGPVNGRAKIERDLDLDFTRLQQLGCKRVICCLFDEELAFLGSPFPQYFQAATNHGIDVVRIPMVEGSTPDTFAEMEDVLDKIDETVKAGGNVIAHCRGGVGRAAVVACCWMLRQGLILDNRSVIAWVRRYRTSKAIETEEQEFYLEGYHVWKASNGDPTFAKRYEDELQNRRRRKDDLQQRQRQEQEQEIVRAQRKAFQEEEDVEERAKELRAENAREEKLKEKKASPVRQLTPQGGLHSPLAVPPVSDAMSSTPAPGIK